MMKCIGWVHALCRILTQFLGVVQVQGDNASELDFGAVQRGDAEMEQKMNRAVRACVERGGRNPICSIHDQGAGGNGERPMSDIVFPFGSSGRSLIHLSSV